MYMDVFSPNVFLQKTPCMEHDGIVTYIDTLNHPDLCFGGSLLNRWADHVYFWQRSVSQGICVALWLEFKL